MDNLYEKRGVSAQKEEVKKATASLYKGLYKHSFCQVFEDIIGNDPNYVNLMHDDTAGTKSVLAYLYWKETGDLDIWKNVAQDCIVMNLDDLICTGAYTNILYTSTISRNKKLIPQEVLKAVIDGTQHFFDTMSTYGINITYAGGETADVGDLVRTIDVAGTMMVRCKKQAIVTNDKIDANQVIVGLASYGQSNYESQNNSGIGSNGLTSARHDMLQKKYATLYPETFEASLDNEVVYIGNYSLTDNLPSTAYTVGEQLLSPTRTFAPIIKQVLENYFENVYGIIHCSGGGQTKCMKYLPRPLKVVKDNLFTPPALFTEIQKQSKASNREMYQVFNMGNRMEIFTNQETASHIITIAKSFNVDAQIIGYTQAAETNELHIHCNNEVLKY
jgi:phosphoribosylformylglycinamidine cyclo-ligase